MTKNVYRMLFLAATMSLFGCSCDEAAQEESAKTFTISTDIHELTRIGQDPNDGHSIFIEDDKVSVYAWAGASVGAPAREDLVVDNVVNTYTSGSWVPETLMLWKNPVEKHYFLGVYPHNATPVADLTKVPYTVDVNDNESSDVLIAYNSTGITSSTDPVNLAFEHVMSRIIVNLTYNNQWGGTVPQVTSVTLCNVAKGGEINYFTQTAMATSDREDITLNCTGRNFQYQSMMIPQDGITTLKIEIDGKDYVYTHPRDLQYEKGKITELRLVVGKDKVTLGGLSIVGWEPGELVVGNTNGYNPAKYITDKSKLDMLYSLKDLEGKQGRVYEMNYTADYKLEDALQAQFTSLAGLQGFVAENLYDVRTSNYHKMSIDAGCSAFAATESATGNYVMGRNYDFCHKNAEGGETAIAAIVVKTAPAGGKKSVSVVDGYWIGMNKGFYRDGKTDLSMLMAAPYAFMDGVNEDGFALGVLHLDGNPTKQTETSKPNIYMSVAMRMLLDKASDVDEAVALLNNYNMYMESPAGGSFHFFMADAKGKYAIVEYVSENDDISGNPWKIDVLTGNDLYRYVTNFYVSDYMKNTPYGINSDHGKKRYEDMQYALWNKNFSLTSAETLNLLDKVSQTPNISDPTSHTQWTSIYNLTQKKLTLYLLREYYGVQPLEFEVQ